MVFNYGNMAQQPISQSPLNANLHPLKKTYSPFDPRKIWGENGKLENVYKALPLSKATVVTIKSYEFFINLEQKLTERKIAALQEAMSNDHSSLKGIWYPEELANYLNKNNKTMPQEYWEGYADPAYFTRNGIYQFILKKGVKASEAIRAFFRGPTIADCGNVIHACYYKALLDVLGDKKFDFIFSEFPEPCKLKITQGGPLNTDNPIFTLVDYTPEAKRESRGVIGKRPVNIGEDCYFIGVPCYPNKHPKGFSGGWSAIYVGDNAKREQLFIAHGFEKPLTEREICMKMVEHHNKERTPLDEDFIKMSSEKHLYDRNNPFLKDTYLISDALAEQLIARGEIGFRPSSQKSFDVPAVIELLQKNFNFDTLIKLAVRKVEIARSMLPL